MAEWIRVCATADVEREDVVGAVANDVQMAIYRSGDDQYFATDAYCTHEKAALCEGLVTDGVIECPLHGGCFEYRSGRAVGPPALVDLKTFPVMVRDGYVHVCVDSEWESRTPRGRL